MDASAFAKLVIAEPESAALRALIESRPRQVSSVVLAVEVRRAAARRGLQIDDRLDLALDRIHLIELDMRIVRRAGLIQPPTLRALDAIHLASALELGSDLEALVTYDGRLAEAARGAGISVFSPA